MRPTFMSTRLHTKGSRPGIIHLQGQLTAMTAIQRIESAIQCEMPCTILTMLWHKVMAVVWDMPGRENVAFHMSLCASLAVVAVSIYAMR